MINIPIHAPQQPIEVDSSIMLDFDGARYLMHIPSKLRSGENNLPVQSLNASRTFTNCTHAISTAYARAVSVFCAIFMGVHVFESMSISISSPWSLHPHLHSRGVPSYRRAEFGRILRIPGGLKDLVCNLGQFGTETNANTHLSTSFLLGKCTHALLGKSAVRTPDNADHALIFGHMVSRAPHDHRICSDAVFDGVCLRGDFIRVIASALSAKQNV